MKKIYNAEDIDKAQFAVKAFEVDFGAKYPEAVAKVVDELDTLLEFYHYPAEHWIHRCTANLTESTFAAGRLHTKVTQGARITWPSLTKLIDAHQARWRARPGRCSDEGGVVVPAQRRSGPSKCPGRVRF